MSLKSVFKTAFPFISAAASLGGPLGSMAAAVVASALGIQKLDATPGAIDAAIATAQIKDPDALLKLQEAEHTFQLQMEKLGFDSVDRIAQIDAEDRANARAREVAVKDKIPAILSLAVTAGFFTILALLLFHLVPEGSRDMLSVLTGTLGTAWIGIINYFFGSSAGSASKQGTISKIAEGKS